MAEKGNNKKEKKRRLKNLRRRYRLLVINEQTFEERLSINLSPLNLVAIVAGTFLIVSAITISVIFFTPIREIVPGHTDAESWRNTVHAAAIADSLQERQRIYEQYVRDRARILNGEVISDSATIWAAGSSSANDIDLDPTSVESAFREKYGEEEAYNIYQEDAGAGQVIELSSIFFFTPLRGAISSRFDRVSDHVGIDIVAPKDEAIKATLDGTVILATWTSSAGYVIQLQHVNDLISVYKHNSVLLKNVGEKVRAGEAIAVIGDTGELTDGPHLHFELWYRGEALDPEEHMVFN